MIHEKALAGIKVLLAYLGNNQNSLVIDADTHATDLKAIHPDLRERMINEPDYYHGRPVSAEDLIAEMDMAGVNMALIWQNPAATFYPGTQQGNFDSLLLANGYIFETAQKYPTRFIPAGWTDPKSLGVDAAKRLVRICVEEFGFAIVKMNPAQNEFPIDSEPVIEVFDYIISLGAVPAFHFGADTEFTPAHGLMNLAKRHPSHPIIGVHMGGGGASYPLAEQLYHDARKIGLQLDNLYYVQSAKRDTHIESDLITYTLAGKQFSKRIFCGSDAPYGRMTWNFGGYRTMLQSLINNLSHTDKRVRESTRVFTEDIARDYMGGNLAKFMIESYQSLLIKHQVKEFSL